MKQHPEGTRAKKRGAELRRLIIGLAPVIEVIRRLK